MRLQRFFLLYCIVHIVIMLFSLPTIQAAGDKCGTFNPDKLKAEQKRIEKGEKVLGSRREMQKTLETSGKNFLIHYDVTGPNRVPPADLNTNGVPDYVDSCAAFMEYAWQQEIVVMGYPAPPSDNGAGGSDAYDIYLIDMGPQGFYGLTNQDFRTGGTTEQPLFASYIEMDNDYSTGDSVNGSRAYTAFGYEALKITAVHEFHHAIQFGNYGVNREAYDVMLYEMFSTWLEFRLFPETKDYLNYVRNIFLNPQEYRFGRRESAYIYIGYGYSVLFEHIAGAAGIQVLNRMWQIIGTGVLPFTALEQALQEANKPLHELWCTMLPKMYYTGSRADNAPQGNTWNNAALMPEIKAMSDTANPVFTNTQSIYPYEIRSIRAMLPRLTGTSQLKDTAYFLYSPAYKTAFADFALPALQSAFTAGSTVNGEPLGNSGYFYSLNTFAVPFCQNAYFSAARLTRPPAAVYPNPYNPSRDQELFFPAPNSSAPGQEALLTILTPVWKPVYSGNITVQTGKLLSGSTEINSRVLRFTGANSLESGVYLYTIEFKDEIITGKFAVQR